MAVGLDVVKKNLEDLEKEITCAVCQEHYTDPKILPCLHCYCKQCILKLSLSVTKSKPFACPECRKDTVLREGGIEGLKSAFIINRLKSMYSKHKKALNKQVRCEICNNAEALAEAFCRQCDKFACKNCVDMHSVMIAIFSGHKCVPIDQLHEIHSEVLLPKPPEPKKCTIHGKKLKIFCFDCHKPICRDCTVKDHRDHDIEFNNVAAEKWRKEVIETLKPLRKIEACLSESLTKVSEVEDEVQVQKKAATDKIRSSFEDLQKILEIRKEQLLNEVNATTKHKIKTLTVQKESLSVASEEVRSVIDHAEWFVRLCSDSEIVLMHGEVTDRIKTQIREHHEQDIVMEPLDKADTIVEVDCADALKQFCLVNAWISDSTMLGSLEIKEAPKTMEAHKEVTFTITNKSDKIVSAKNLKCQFYCISTEEIFEADANSTKLNEYFVVFTPTVRGCYEVTINAYSNPVSESSFTVTAYLNPAEFKKPTKVWNKIAKPFSIAANSRKEILVVDIYKFIVAMNKEGDIVRTVDMKSLLVDSLRSIAVDNEGNIYYIEFTSSRLGKCDYCFNNIKVQDVQQEQGRGHYSIEIVADEVLVTERFNKGQIVVYDKDLNFVRRISTGSNTSLRHICPDCHGNLFASTDDNSVVVLNSINGSIQLVFSQEQRGMQVLKSPWMVHVFGHYVYVADFGLGKTVVFTTAGEYIATLDNCGPVCVDEAGVVFHCDSFNDYCVKIY